MFLVKIFLEESAECVVLTKSCTPRGRQKYLEEGAHLHHLQGGSVWGGPTCLLLWVTPGIPECGFLSRMLLPV